MKSFGIGKKLFISFGGLLAILAILAAHSLSMLNRLDSNIDNAVNRTTKRLVLADDIESNISGMMSSQRGMFQWALLKDASQAAKMREDFKKYRAKAQSSLDGFAPLIATEEGRKAIQQIQSGLDSWDKDFDEIDRSLSAGNADEAATMAKERTRPLVAEITDLSAKLRRIQLDFLENDKKTTSDTLSQSRWMTSLLVALAAAIGVAVFVLIRGISSTLTALARDLSSGSEQVASAASQVAGSAQSLAQGASEQAAALEETSSFTAEISATISQNSQCALKAANLVSQSSKQFADTEQQLGDMVTAMAEISGASSQVAKIIKVIDEIAFQTNILALNAAVEAARAGQSGMGFAVVAEEVRNLAQRCAKAAKDTEVLIETAISKSAHGAQKVHEVEQSIAKATEQALEMKTLVDEVSLGSQEQKNGLEQIAKAISQMEQVTQQTAAGAEESASAGEELNAQAETLRGSVGELTRLIEGAGAVEEPIFRELKPIAHHLAFTTGHGNSNRKLNFHVSSANRNKWLTDTESDDQFVNQN